MSMINNGQIKVLVADDNRAFVELIASFLQKRGLEVLTARDGREARSIIENHGPELVITDLVMPVLNGFELCRFIRNAETVGFTYVVVMTAKSDAATLSAAFDAGADDCIRKPFNEQELISRVRSAERIIRLEASYRQNAMRLHRVNAEVAAANDRLLQKASMLTASNETATIEKAAAEKACREKSDFLANMSHELRSPLSAILGYAELLHSDGDISKAPPQRVKALETILRNGNHLLEVINEVLELSKIDAGQFRIEPAPCRPVDIVEEVRDLLQVMADEKGLGLTTDVDGPIPDIIESDPVRIRQILINLVTNAIKFTERGSVRIVLRQSRNSQDNDCLQFDVIDTGIGLTLAQQRDIFNRFSQADNQGRASGLGTGLGLVISKQFAQLLGGDIELDSQPGKGSTFRLTVATAGVGQAAAADARSLPDAEPTNTLDRGHPSSNLGAVRVLLAEDNEDSQRLLCEFMRRADIDSAVAPDGKAVVDMAIAAESSDKPFDMILMDRQLPIMSGVEATAQLRARGFRKPVIGLSAGIQPHEINQMMEAGCVACEAKPITQEKLIHTIRHWIHHEGGTDMGPKNATSEPIISTLAGDPDMHELVREFVDALPGKASQLQDMLAARDIESLARLAHQLKGSAGGYGFPAITDHAAQLEDTAKHTKDIQKLNDQVRQIADMCHRASGAPR